MNFRIDEEFGIKALVEHKVGLGLIPRTTDGLPSTTQSQPWVQSQEKAKSSARYGQKQNKQIKKDNKNKREKKARVWINQLLWKCPQA